MTLVARRNFVAGLGLGAASPLLSPLCRRLVREAQGAEVVHRRILFVSQGNAWNHGGDTKGSTAATPTGQKSGMFRAGFRSPQDFDLPVFMEALTPWKREMAIWFGLLGHNASPANHGPDSRFMLALPEKVDGISIDRLVGNELKKRYADVHAGTIMGPVLKSYGSKNCGAPSYDGPGRRADSYMTPVQAYAAYFGAASGMSPAQMQGNLELERSLFDAMREDLARTRRRLAAREAEKLDQVTTSLRELEQKLVALQGSARPAGKPPAPTVDASGLDPTIIRAMSDLTVQAQAFGLTHVSHLSLHGGAAFDDDNWKPLAGADFNNYGQNHNGLFHTENDTASDHIRKMHRFTASEIAWVRGALGKIPVGAGTLADETVIVWTVQGGLRHHNGSTAHTMVLLGGAKTRLAAPLWADFLTVGQGFDMKGSQHIGQAFVSLANAVDLPTTSFGMGQGALPGVLRG